MEEKLENREEAEIDLGTWFFNFLRGFCRFWWLIAVLALLGAAALYLKSSRFYTPIYQSSATFTVMTDSGDESTGENYNFYYNTTTAGQLAATFPYILGSDLLTEAMKEDMGVEYINGSVSAQVVSNSNLVSMTATSSSPEDAQKILESAIRVYPQVSRFVIGNTKFNMIDVPNLPTEPYNRPSYTAQVKKGAMIGAALGFLVIVVYALLKKTVQKPAELKKVMSLPCIGNVPDVKFKARTKRRERDLSISNSRAPQGYKETVLNLELRLERDLEAEEGKILLVTSTVAGEGKSTLAANLARAAAAHGKNVLLVDADLRKQDARRQLSGQKGRGLEAVISGACGLWEAVEKDSVSGMWFLSGSQPAKRIPRLLNSAKLTEIFSQMKEKMDLVILDAPPADLFEDAGILAGYSDGVLYLVRHDFVQRRKIVDGVSALEGSGAKILGYAFNCVPVHRGGYGYYGYGRYGYGYYGKYGYGKYGYGKYGYGDKGQSAEWDRKSF